jgi:hypothetical protein
MGAQSAKLRQPQRHYRVLEFAGGYPMRPNRAARQVPAQASAGDLIENAD